MSQSVTLLVAILPRIWDFEEGVGRCWSLGTLFVYQGYWSDGDFFAKILCLHMGSMELGNSASEEYDAMGSTVSAYSPSDGFQGLDVICTTAQKVLAFYPKEIYSMGLLRLIWERDLT